MDSSVLPIFLMLACTLVLAVGMLLVARLLNRGRPSDVQQMPYESGMDPIHDTRRRFDVRFYLLAIAFLIFDVELLFLFPWAVSWGSGNQTSVVGSQRKTVSGRWAMASEPQLEIARPGSPSGASRGNAPVAPSTSPDEPQNQTQSRHLVFAGAMTFLALLVIGYVYDWRKGIFQWR
ncbi:MAG: NADH-quinone oxidoreductase subunit A [Planctomycetaceae bacterium]|nr:NADH-quinone oxidoreductase subunit A [Planctomycetaceae bacterium]